MKVKFIKNWITKKGWNDTNLKQSDFVHIEYFGATEKGENIFLATNKKGALHILKGERQ